MRGRVGSVDEIGEDNLDRIKGWWANHHDMEKGSGSQIF